MTARAVLRIAARVLVVDDDASTRSGLSRLLALEGYTVDTVPNGAAALALVAVHPPDVVLTDLMMPGMDGIALLVALHKQHPGLPVIVATGAWDLEAAVRAVRAGAHDYLAKPVDFAALRVMLERVLDRQRASSIDSVQGNCCRVLRPPCPPSVSSAIDYAVDVQRGPRGSDARPGGRDDAVAMTEIARG